MTKTLIPEDEVRFFSGSSNQELAAKIAGELGVPLDGTHISRFSNQYHRQRQAKKVGLIG